MTLMLDELAELLWRKHAGGTGEFDDAPQVTQRTYRAVAESAIGFVAARDEGRAVEVAKDLADQLAFKYNNPRQFVDSVRESLDGFAELVGVENLTDEVKKARKL